MDSIIHNAIKNGAKPHQLVRLRGGRYYFFFRQEMENQIVDRHHAVPHKGRIFDYTNACHYETLADWARAFNHTTNDICYGINRDYCGDQRVVRVFVSLHNLLKKLDPSWNEYAYTATLPNYDDTIIKNIQNSLNAIQDQVNYIKNMLAGL